MPYVISKEIEFDAGHRVPNHDSKCKNPHGHRYKVAAVVRAEDVIKESGHPQEGMLADFGFLKQALTECVHDPLDHGFIVWENDIVLKQVFNFGPIWKIIDFPYIPTAENLARWAFGQLLFWFAKHSAEVHDFRLVQVRVWETPTSLAIYGEQGWNV
jgi:6-pyruvoyltetrahydropterin/6-carboxytetrahydropterin synthase